MAAGYDASRVRNSGTNNGTYISIHPAAVHKIIHHGAETALPGSWEHKAKSWSRSMEPVLDEDKREIARKDWKLKEELEAKAHVKQFPESFGLYKEIAARRGMEPTGKSAAWTRKEGQNPKGGLNAKGRASAKREGHNLKPPVKSGDNPRRASFLARMGGSPGPEYDEHGEPTRLLLALQAWGASSKVDARRKAKAMSERLKHKQVQKALVFLATGDDDLLKGRGAAARSDPSSYGVEKGHSIHDPNMLGLKAMHDQLEKFSSLLEDRPPKPFFGRFINAGDDIHTGYFGPQGMISLTASPTDHTDPDSPTKMKTKDMLTPGAPVAHPKILYLRIAHDAPEPVTEKHEQEIFHGLWRAGYRGRNMTYAVYPDVESTASKYAHLRAARGLPPRAITAQRDHLFAPVRKRWAEFVDGKNREQHSPEPESHLQRSMNKGIDNLFHMAIDPVTLGLAATGYAGYKAYRKLRPKLAEGIKRFKEMQGEQKPETPESPVEERGAEKSISTHRSTPLVFRSFS